MGDLFDAFLYDSILERVYSENKLEYGCEASFRLPDQVLIPDKKGGHAINDCFREVLVAHRNVLRLQGDPAVPPLLESATLPALFISCKSVLAAEEVLGFS